MARDAVPLIHVVDVAATAAWYQNLGFDLVESAEDDGLLTWACMKFGDGEVMFNAGGSASRAPRREVDLFLYVHDCDAWFAEVGGQAELIEGPHDTFYGMREFTMRDLNGFWITFAAHLEREAS
jgi:uncharacterized glyoxalase superfamily protein PhnB